MLVSTAPIINKRAASEPWVLINSDTKYLKYSITELVSKFRVGSTLTCSLLLNNTFRKGITNATENKPVTMDMALKITLKIASDL